MSSRSTEAYKTKITSTMKSRFPSKSHKDIAQDAVCVPRIVNILKERIGKALELHSTELSADDFLRYTDIPEALVITPALLSRPRNTPGDVLKFLKNYSESDGKPSEHRDWVHNNLVGSLLELYRPYGRLCPIYSGYDTFFTMANKNLRHFLIICYKALEIAELADECGNEVSQGTQARAAYEAADQLIREIKTFGPQGERLRMFVLRLGNVFRALQATPAMSEPEQNQFTINSGDRVPDAEELEFLAELKKYGIISEQLETKTKGPVGSDIVDYQLNPIYSPYFQISYRRKRKISLSLDQFHILALGTEDEYKSLSLGILKSQEIPRTQGELWK